MVANAVAKTISEAIESITVEDIELYTLGYNNAVKEFAKRMNIEILGLDSAFDRTTLYKTVGKVAEGMELV